MLVYFVRVMYLRHAIAVEEAERNQNNLSVRNRNVENEVTEWTKLYSELF